MKQNQGKNKVPPLFGDPITPPEEPGPNLDSISVDASCIGNPGYLEYQAVETRTRKILFKESFEMGTNNVGEFLAIVHALVYAHKKGLNMPIYSDSTTAITWVKKKICKTSLKRTKETERIFDFIDKSEIILREYTFTNPVLKWETKRWGQIPADFGRK